MLLRVDEVHWRPINQISIIVKFVSLKGSTMMASVRPSEFSSKIYPHVHVSKTDIDGTSAAQHCIRNNQCMNLLLLAAMHTLISHSTSAPEKFLASTRVIRPGRNVGTVIIPPLAHWFKINQCMVYLSMSFSFPTAAFYSKIAFRRMCCRRTCCRKTSSLKSRRICL